MATLNYTTRIAPSTTAGEIQQELARHDVAQISTRFADGRAVGIGFVLNTPNGPREFHIDVDVDGVRALLIADEQAGRFAGARKAAGTFSSAAHAERVAWRITKDWLEAQLALVEARMATLDEVMLPFLVINPAGETLREVYRTRENLALQAAGAHA